MTDAVQVMECGGACPEWLLSLLRCPNCQQMPLVRAERELLCSHCTLSISAARGFVDLAPDPKADTLLDVASYAAAIPAELRHSLEIAELYTSIIRDRAPRALDVVFEIGSGSGQLSLGLCQSLPTSRMICSDVSARFLDILGTRLAPSRADGRVSLCRVDANSLPFGDGTLSAVVGHSVLHHLAHYEHTVKECHRVLAPGGVAVFGEPIMDHFALLSLVCAMILEMDQVRRDPKLSVPCKAHLGYMAALAQEKSANHRADRSALSEVEDKFVFEIARIRAIGREAGFRDVDVVQHSPIPDLGSSLLASLRAEAHGRADALDGVDSYQHVFDMVQSAIGMSLPNSVSHGFAIFAFVK